MSFPNSSLFPHTAEVTSQGNLVLGGCDTVQLAAEFGTPLYVFDEVTLRGMCREFVGGFRERYPDSAVIYACKAFINVALAQLLKEEGLGLDVVSGGELAVAQRVDFPPENIYFHGNNKSREELEMALDYGIGRVVVDNFHEMDLLGEIASKRGVVQDVLLRVSPGIDPHTHVYTTTGVLDSKFGFSIQMGQAQEAAVKVMGAKNIRLVGLHFHLGSPIFELEPYTRAMEVTLDFASQVGLPLQEISPGGGFAIAYTRDQRPPSVEEYAEAIVGLATYFNVTEYCRIGGMYDSVPHTRPLLVTGTLNEEQAERASGLASTRKSTYQGPTSIVNLVAEVLTEQEVVTTSLMAHLPQYVQLDEDHLGASRLMEVLSAVYGFPSSFVDHTRGEQQYKDLSRAVENNPEVKKLITQLERYYDRVLVGPQTEEDQPSLSPDVEKFLREMGDRLEQTQDGSDDE
ncbi:MAG: PAC2 family protein [Chloroflexi bacterium]|nr:PAC2 family protein [Chloroflexota bacterium]